MPRDFVSAERRPAAARIEFGYVVPDVQYVTVPVGVRADFRVLGGMAAAPGQRG